MRNEKVRNKKAMLLKLRLLIIFWLNLQYVIILAFNDSLISKLVTVNFSIYGLATFWQLCHGFVSVVYNNKSFIISFSLHWSSLKVNIVENVFLALSINSIPNPPPHKKNRSHPFSLYSNTPPHFSMRFSLVMECFH